MVSSAAPVVLAAPYSLLADRPVLLRSSCPYFTGLDTIWQVPSGPGQLRKLNMMPHADCCVTVCCIDSTSLNAQFTWPPPLCRVVPDLVEYEKMRWVAIKLMVRSNSDRILKLR
jgi:hypothetical protein